MSKIWLPLLDVSITTLLAIIIICSCVVYTIYGAVWRIYLSQIAHIPGPRFAALTFWNEFYYDIILGGKYTWKLLDYHQKYGTVFHVITLGHTVAC